MDDGHLKQNKHKPQKIILSTDNFTKSENQQLIYFLYERFNLSFQLDNQNRIILYDQYQVFYFLHLVAPFIHSSMIRKIIRNYTFKFSSTSRRTTIYLPVNIKLTSPTQEINAALNGLKKVKKNFKNGLFYKIYSPMITYIPPETRPYQIVVKSKNLENLYFLKEVTGLTFSLLSSICFNQKWVE